jgi:hypothetical protein
VKITSPRAGGRSTPAVPDPAPGAATDELEPVSLRAFVSEEFEETFIDIFELQPKRRLVTSIEVLSPSN